MHRPAAVQTCRCTVSPSGTSRRDRLAAMGAEIHCMAERSALTRWCRERESNPHESLSSPDFESGASTSSAIPARTAKLTRSSVRKLINVYFQISYSDISQVIPCSAIAGANCRRVPVPAPAEPSRLRRGLSADHVACGRHAFIARRVLACDDVHGQWPCLLLALAAPAGADESLVSELVAAAPAANPKVLSLAARAADCARRQGLLDGFHHLAVIDYSLPSTQPRLWVFDVDRGRLLFQELVAHGRNTGEKVAEHFSNVEGSKMSSLGLFQATDTYYGNNGYSLRLRGLDAGFNDNALSRAIVMHGAPYVSEAIAARLGRLGRSWGCPAVRQEVARSRDRHAEGRGAAVRLLPRQQVAEGVAAADLRRPGPVAGSRPTRRRPRRAADRARCGPGPARAGPSASMRAPCCAPTSTTNCPTS